MIDEARVRKLRRLNIIFFYLSLSFLIISVGFDIATFILVPRIGYTTLVYIFLEASSILFAGSIALFVVRFAVIGTKLRNIYYPRNGAPAQNPNVVETEVTEVKEAPKTKEEQLVDEYEKLLKQGYITQEEFDEKKKEILSIK
ncbi:MAG: SHOCT domain-containing protein [Bacilli bacterium]|nr:SHOCT domain-containing protein [Bacilli bacterium]